MSVTLNQRLVALANSLGGKDEDEIMAAVAEIERLTARIADLEEQLLRALGERK